MRFIVSLTLPDGGEVDLILTRAPTLLRFVSRVRNGITLWDALDQLDDAPRRGETVLVALLVDIGEAIHFKCRARSESGWHRKATYAVHECQPDRETAWDTARWREWCRGQVGTEAES